MWFVNRSHCWEPIRLQESPVISKWYNKWWKVIEYLKKTKRKELSKSPPLPKINLNAPSSVTVPHSKTSRAEGRYNSKTETWYLPYEVIAYKRLALQLFMRSIWRQRFLPAEVGQLSLGYFWPMKFKMLITHMRKLKMFVAILNLCIIVAI